MSPGKPVLARPSVWILLVIMFSLLGLGIASGIADEAKRNVGGCTRGLQFVDCGETHDGVILKIVTDKSNCPVEADSYLQERSRIYCLKNS